MNAILSIAALLFGGVVLPPIDSESSTSQTTAPQFDLGPERSAGGAPSPGLAPRQAYPTRGDRSRNAASPDRRSQATAQPGSPTAQGAERPQTMPALPTESAAEETVPLALPTAEGNMLGVPGQPLIQSQPTNPGGRTQSYGARRYGSSAFETRSRSGFTAYGSPQSSSSTSLYGRNTTQYKAAATHARQGGSQKPFSGYREPPAISPYLNLFRNDNNLGTIDNYTTLVRPFVQQRNMNTQVGQQIRGLQNTAVQQNQAIGTLGRETQRLQGVSSPQYYQQYGDFYPGFNR